MPEHTSFFNYLLEAILGHTALEENMRRFGHTISGKPVGAHGAEPLAAALFIVLLVIALAYRARGQVADYDKSVIPDEKLSLRTFFELFVSYFYGLMKDMMGADRAKRYFPLVGTCAVFIFFSNMLGLIPGFLPPTSSWNITAGCALVVFVVFNYYGIKEHGLVNYLKHFAGPWIHPLALPINILIFGIEVLSMLIRPVTLSIRLMVNMAVDHMLLGLFMGLVAIFLPVPIMMLGTLVALVQTLVFCLLAAIYIALATEHEEGEHGHGHGAAHAEPAHA
ncbi:MAG TPA: F0F1 ATP synthase subunit A [Polyangiaceae bacterium]|nr:F0F1 ATP synthase subunit A [Polyangiaceae bacterium]